MLDYFLNCTSLICLCELFSGVRIRRLCEESFYSAGISRDPGCYGFPRSWRCMSKKGGPS